MESQRVPSNLIAVGSPNKKSECGSQLTTVRLLNQIFICDFVIVFKLYSGR